MAFEQNEFYLGDPNLPTAKAEFEYTPHMVQEIKRCARDIFHFAENYFFITTLEEGKRIIKLYTPQKRVVKALVKKRFVILLSARQSGKTSLMTIYALWTACFKSDKRVLIVANKEDTAIMILRRIRMAYEQLPNWLKPGVKQWGKTEVIFANDSSVSISSTTATTARGESCNCVGGKSMVTLKDKPSGKIFDITVEELSLLLKEQGEILDMELVSDGLG